MDFFIFLLPLGGALAARLAYRRWQAWAVWLASGLFAFLAAWLANGLEPVQSAGAALGASLLGFILPELWEALRGFLRRPRNVGYLVAGAGVIYALSEPQLLGSLMTLGIVGLGFWLIIRPLFRR